MSIDAIGNFLTVVRNALMASKPFAVVPHSKLKERIALILKNEGFVRDVSVVEDETGRKGLKVLLKYVDGESVIHELTRVSTPGRRCYTSITRIKPVIGGLGISILSTNKGVLTDKQAYKLNVGGEILCTVW